MEQNIKKVISVMIDMHSELEMYISYKSQLLLYLDSAFNEYQSQKLDYEKYRKKLGYMLKGKTKEWWVTYYDSYIVSLVNQLQDLNNQVFYLMFRDKTFEKLQINVAPIEKVQELHEDIQKEKLKEVLSKPDIVEEHTDFSRELYKSGHDLKTFKKFEIDLKHLLFPAKQKSILKNKKIPKDRSIPKEKNIAKQKKSKVKISDDFTKEESKDIKSTFLNFSFIKNLFSDRLPSLKPEIKKATEAVGKRSGFNKKEVETFEDYIKKQTATVGYVKKGFFGNVSQFWRTFFISLFHLKQDSFDFGSDNSVGDSLLSLQAKDKLAEGLSKRLKSVNINSKLLRKEAERITELKKRRKIEEVKKVSLYVVFANKSMKPITRFLISLFPEFFKNIYNALRLANIGLLSNTYVNVLVLSSLISAIGSFFFFSMFYFFIDPLPLISISKGFITSMLITLITIAGFTIHPYSKIKKRRTSINTNLPFAINHMAAVASSGVSPIVMFELISDSNEYGEICVEASRIVDYVHMFGYDLSTALKSVSGTTPSKSFKEFLEGLTSNIHIGTEIHKYMNQKADEAMTSYSIERQKYLEQIGTYSDIYTGILVAAPLFFITALSLISMLGGEIGGLDVSILIAIGTYLVIPILNVFFILFLTLTQPEY